MGLTPHDYYCMSPVEFYLASKGFHKARQRQWEHTRFTAYTIRATVPRQKGEPRLPSMTKWLPLPTDEGKELSDARVKEMLEKAKAKINGSK